MNTKTTSILEGVTPANRIVSTTVSIFNTTLAPLLASAPSAESGPDLSKSKLVEIVVYMVIWLFGTVGTLLVAYVVLTSRKFKSSTNTHLLNLALADLIYLQGSYHKRDHPNQN